VDIPNSWAAEALGKVGGAAAIAALCGVLADTATGDCPHLRICTYRALASLGDPQATQPIIQSLGQGGKESPYYILDAVQALGATGGQAVVAFLRQILRDSSQEVPVRDEAARSLLRLSLEETAADVAWYLGHRPKST